MKVAIIGIGSVGSAVATAVQNTGLVNEIVLFDRDGLRAQAAAEDLGHASTFSHDIKITAISNYRSIKGSDIVIISAGANQKIGETRNDLLQKNAAVIYDIVPKIMQYVDKKFVKIIVVTNPLDPMVMLTQQLSKLPYSRVIGTGTMLDSARFKTILSRYFGISNKSINAYVLGEHGDSSVINWSSVTIGGIQLEDFCKQTNNPIHLTTKKTIEHRIKNAAYEIIKGRGATWDGIGASVSDLLKAIINNEKRILTTSIVERNNSNTIAFSMPRIIDTNGASLQLRPKLSSEELSLLRKSAKIIKNNFNNIK